MRTLAYLLYGDKQEYQLELTYSVLTATNFLINEPKDVRLLLITQERFRRDDLPIEHLYFSDADLRDWTYDGRYNHGAKVHALDLALQHSGGQAILIDTDTAFKSSPRIVFDRIKYGQCVLHEIDAPLNGHEIWQPFLNDRAPVTISGYRIEGSSPMFNSGVMGLDQSMRPLLEDVIALTGEIWRSHAIFNAEQFAFSTVLNTHTNVALCDDIIWHYWGFERRFCHMQIAELFPQFSRAAFDRHLDNIPSIGMPPKRAIHKVRARVLQAIRQADEDYRFAYLSYLSALSCSDKKLANGWAMTSLDAIKLQKQQSPRIASDFAAFGPLNIENLEWIDARTKDSWKLFWLDFKIRGE